ncbi:MAG: TIGR03768 family metallophosphoesterase [Phycisphaerae bacterium]|nr:TIGR03768 family metallophosphoesterase [Phycisphaerae bacterium]
MRNSAPRFFGLSCALALQLPLLGCGLGDICRCPGPNDPQPTEWPIAKDVFTTAQQQILPIALPANTPHINPADVPLYEVFGYSAWQVGEGLSQVKRTDLAPGYKGAPNAARLLSFFCMTDIHIADKESPAQPIYVGWSALYGADSSGLSSAYSPIILSTTHVLDAAVQTINALHQKSPFDFGISLGDNINNTQYNELRWFIDVMDGKVITPSSGAHLGADTIDYQKPFQAVGLDKSIPWFQVIGNHDQFWMGSAFENAKTQQAHIGTAILNMADDPNPASDAVDRTGYYMGVVDGSTQYGDIIGAGPEEWFPTPPTVVADPNRRSLATSTSTSLNWMREFFTTTSDPVGHGFTQANLDSDSACYSFQPKSDIPIKVIALDDTCKGPNQPNYALGCLDKARLDWLETELQEGQDHGKLMIIAAHVPIYPQQDFDPNSGNYPLLSSTSCIDDLSLLAILHNYPNLILWIAGHRHVNVVTPQPSPDPINHPEQSFWEVETSSLRDFPQQFRTFDIRRNSDNTISIIITDVDPAVVEESPAAKSRGYAIGAARIFGANDSAIPPTREDTTSHAYNAELVKQLTPEMQAIIANCGSPIGGQ